MCSILLSDFPYIDSHLFKSALMQMDYRGPDASGCFEINNVKLGHNRLSILDLNPRSNQPFTSNDGRYIIIYNGEIYNYLDLAKKYNILMKTHSDTELILELSIIIGFKNALNEFNGIFAYIIFDTVTQDYFIARDRLGVKPLYYYHVGNNYIFSSEINAIVVLLKNDIQIDEIGLRQYRKLRTFFNGYTIYKDIKMFPAGCFMEHKIITAYWEMPMGEQKPPDDDELKDLIEDSIKCRKIADVPLGSYLSGGLDSTIVAAITKELHTWTVGFEENNEFKWGRLAAKKIGSNHHEIITNSQMFINDTKVMIKRRKEPLSVPNEVLLYEMTKEVKKENTVVLCGEGADELFFGYNRIFSWANRTDTFDIKNFSNLYAYGSNDDLEIVESVISPFYKYGKPINIVAAFFQVAHLHGLLRRLDSSTMLCSVEAREPFVDYRLVERMAGVSFTYRMQDGIVKAPLKRIFKDIVPIEIIEREKVGFPVDLAHIFKVHTEKAFDYWLDFNMNVLMQGR